MIEYTRPTFEEFYKNIISNSFLYELKVAIPKARKEQSEEAAKQDVKAFHDLINIVCNDMTLLLGRKFKRTTRFGILNIGNYHVVLQGGWLNAYIAEYKLLLPNFINSTIKNLTPKNKDSWCFPRIGRINWEGNDAKITTVDKKITLTDVEIKPPYECDLPKHIQIILEKSKKTKFDYSPYILVGSNNQKVLAIKMGNNWNDIAIGYWTPPKIDNFTKCECRLMGGSLSLMFLMIWGIISCNNFYAMSIMGPIGFLALALTIVTGRHSYIRNFQTIKV